MAISSLSKPFAEQAEWNTKWTVDIAAALMDATLAITVVVGHESAPCA